MQKYNNIALKEWVVVCAALARGTQQILFRKGGIHEGPDGFQPEHSEFWMFPTGFHQSTEGIRPQFQEEAAVVLKEAAAPGSIPVRHYCVIQGVHWIDRESQLQRLQPFHVQTDEALAKRFHYRQPGLYALVVQTLTLPSVLPVPMDSRYDGCHSWVTLNETLLTDDLQANPVARQSRDIEAMISEILQPE